MPGKSENCIGGRHCVTHMSTPINIPYLQEDLQAWHLRQLNEHFVSDEHLVLKMNILC